MYGYSAAGIMERMYDEVVSGMEKKGKEQLRNDQFMRSIEEVNSEKNKKGGQRKCFEQ